MKRLWLWLWMHVWRTRLAQARAYRADLDRAFAVERKRAEHDVEHCEMMERRASIELVRMRADKALGQRKLFDEV